MDLSPQLSDALQVIQAYGDGGFTLSERKVKGSVLVFPDKAEEWKVNSVADLTLESLKPVMEADPAVEILLIGTGTSQALISPTLKDALRVGGMAVDSMDTGAACRTYNILMSEDRRVAAALIAV